MKYKLHISSSMFLTDPYVVRIKHPESPSRENMNLSEFRRLLKMAKNSVSSWGYSNPMHEVVKSDGETVSFGGGYCINLPVFECHSYWVFTNELDALQFRLTAGENASQMHMWPTRIKYTIMEYYGEDPDS